MTGAASAAACLCAQEPAPPPPEFVCPMDPDVRSPKPGKCPRCGMTLEARIPAPSAYDLEFTANPPAIPPGQPVELAFRLRDPATHQPATRFETVHEKLFHLFAVSQDLNWFLHDHPVLGADGIFRLPVTFPSAGLYDLFLDFYPSGGTPQWISRFLYTKDAGAFQPRELKPDILPRHDAGVEVSMEMDPEPFAGRKTILFFRPEPGDGLELYLGTYAHALWVSHDLLDAEHTHPILMGDLQFQVIFPRQGTYRFWMQFQRKGTLHTVHFDIPVVG